MLMALLMGEWAKVLAKTIDANYLAICYNSLWVAIKINLKLVDDDLMSWESFIFKLFLSVTFDQLNISDVQLARKKNMNADKLMKFYLLASD